LKRRRLWTGVGWVQVLLVIYLSLMPVPGFAVLPMEQGDKIAHVLAYGVLMSWFANLYGRLHERWLLAVGFIAMGIALEFVQRWMGFRAFEVSDMVAGALGVGAGWVAAPPRLPNFLAQLERTCGL
jgi:hypothetical protein